MPSPRAVAAVHRDRGDRRDPAVGDRRPARRATADDRGAAAGAAAADRPRRRRDDPRNPPGHPVLHGRADRRGPHRDVGAGPGQEARRLLGAVVRGRSAGRCRRRIAGSARAPSRYSSAAPPPCRSRSPVRPAPRRPRRRPAPSRPSRDSGYVPANVEQPFAQNINAVLISPPQAPVDLNVAAADRRHWPRAATQHHQPRAVGRRRGDAVREHVYDNGVRAGVVHHTAGSNDYAPQDSAGIVRSIYEYHTRTLGWCDIAYNALVDKYGQVFEGRAGGMDRPVEGSHTGGFNQQHLGRGDDRQLRRRAADPDPAAHHRPAAGLAARHRPRRPAGHGRADLGGRLVHPVPARRHADAADDLHPPRRRQHRLPGQRRVRGDGPLRDIAARFNDPPGPRTWPTRCAAARSSPGGSRWAG